MAGGEPGEEGGEQDDRDRAEAEAEAEVRERVVDLGQGPRELHRQAGSGLARVDAHAGAVDLLVGEERPALAVAHRLHLAGIAEPVLLARRRHHPVAGDELEEHRRPLERLDLRERAGRQPGA